MKVGYMDEVVPEYGAALDKCTTFGDCMSVLDRYRELFPDALAAAPKNAIEFDQFQRGLRKERKGTFAGEQWLERFGAVMMPALAIQVAEVAMRFHVPWGLAFNRLVDAGRVRMVNGAYRWVAANGVRACGSNECVAGQRDGVLCANGECDRENGVRPNGVATRHPRCGYPYCACVGECFAASQPGVTAGVPVESGGKKE